MMGAQYVGGGQATRSIAKVDVSPVPLVGQHVRHHQMTPARSDGQLIRRVIHRSLLELVLPA